MNIIQWFKSKDWGDRFGIIWGLVFASFVAIALLPSGIKWAISEHPAPKQPKYKIGDVVYLKPDSAIAVIAEIQRNGTYLVAKAGWNGSRYGASDQIIYGKKP